MEQPAVREAYVEVRCEREKLANDYGKPILGASRVCKKLEFVVRGT